MKLKSAGLDTLLGCLTPLYWHQMQTGGDLSVWDGN